MAHLLAALEARLDTEVKIADGAANLLRVFDTVAPGAAAAGPSSSSPAPLARPERPRRRVPRSARPSSSGSAASSGRGSPPGSSGSMQDSDADGSRAEAQNGEAQAGKEALRRQVQKELDNANARIVSLVRQIDELKMRGERVARADAGCGITDAPARQTRRHSAQGRPAQTHRTAFQRRCPSLRP
jgi:hypothetical protein